jgi:uncharacterized phage-like protein YoqJ
MIIVKKLGTRKTVSYVGITPRQAVIAAYAQDKKDWNTWNYDKYQHIVQETDHIITCGDWSITK